MLHPINLPDCFEALWIVVSIQEELLKLACITDPRDINLLKVHFNDETAQWLWLRKQRLLDPLESFIKHPDPLEKQAVLAAFRHDITYDDHLNDPSFVFQLQPKSNAPSPLAVKVGEWLEKFYDVTIPTAITGYTVDIDQQLILSEFSAINKGICVCPTCDGTWMEPTSTGIYGSIDHFLPRSKYPALSVHPFNLLPICSTCNEKLKKGKDPLSDNQPRTIVDTFIFCSHSNPPRPARDNVSLQIDANTAQPWLFQGQATPLQLSIFTDIFDLPGRWQVRIDEIDRIVRRRLKDILSLSLAKSTTISRNTFHAILNDLEQRMRREWGESNYLFPATWWLRWLHQYKFDDLAKEFLK